MAAFTADEIRSKLSEIEGWSLQEKEIRREFDTGNFANAAAFLVKIACEAEKMDHHPDVCIHGYNKMLVILSTHDKGGVTDKDLQMAKKINTLL
ncbi:MAG: 4a-hydroxytetrahydrobiopterin dehydratase [Syntrophothermus sp.]